jgi:hypothetical protein
LKDGSQEAVAELQRMGLKGCDDDRRQSKTAEAIANRLESMK